MARVHDDELDIDEALVRTLLEQQFPEWAGLSLERVEPEGTVNVIYRLGAQLAVRLPRRDGPDVEDVEFRWLPVLSPLLPLDVPVPAARGKPGAGYPWFWSVHTWISGITPEGPVAPDALAGFIAALQHVDTADAPEPSGGRGKPLAWRDGLVRDALERVDAPGARELWEESLAAAEWPGARVWIHADLDARNVLVRNGRLAAVIDWGGAGIGDPALDAMAAWKLVARDQRERFRSILEVDDATWLRAKGWAVSQALLALRYYTLETNPTLVREARRWLGEVIAG